MNLGASRIIIVVALIAAGIGLLANGFPSPSVTVGASPSGSPTPSSGSSPTESSSPTEPPSETPQPQTDGVLIQVFNGTNVAHLAGDSQSTLEDDGYVAASDAMDAPTKGVQKTVVYYRGGDAAAQNRSDAQYVADTYFSGAKVQELSAVYDEIVDKDTELAIVLGEDFATTQA